MFEQHLHLDIIFDDGEQVGNLGDNCALGFDCLGRLKQYIRIPHDKVFLLDRGKHGSTVNVAVRVTLLVRQGGNLLDGNTQSCFQCYHTVSTDKLFAGTHVLTFFRWVGVRNKAHFVGMAVQLLKVGCAPCTAK